MANVVHEAIQKGLARRKAAMGAFPYPNAFSWSQCVEDNYACPACFGDIEVLLVQPTGAIDIFDYVDWEWRRLDEDCDRSMWSPEQAPPMFSTIDSKEEESQMKLTVLDDGKIRVSFRGVLITTPESVTEDVHKVINEIIDQSKAMLEAYGSEYSQNKKVSTILVTESGISTSTARPVKKAEKAEEVVSDKTLHRDSDKELWSEGTPDEKTFPKSTKAAKTAGKEGDGSE